MKMTARWRAKVRSGRPGSARLCSRKRRPSPCSADRNSRSGLVSRPRIPDIIRLRVAASTMSAKVCRAAGAAEQVLLRLPCDPRSHMLRDSFHDRHHHRVAELLVRLRVRNRNPEWTVGLIESHEPRAFSWSEPPRRLSLSFHQNFGPVLVVARGKRPCNVIWSNQPEAKAIAFL